jgi:tRNA dimethylallyltransferase
MEGTNRRRILRALEVTLGSGRTFSSYGPGLQNYPPTRFRMYGPRWSREEINERIDSRFKRQLTDGFLNEVRQLISNGKEISRTARQALGYRQFLDHLEGKCTLEEAIDLAKRSIKKFARKQDRWFRRDPRIQWFDIDENSLEVVPTLVEEWRQCV